MSMMPCIGKKIELLIIHYHITNLPDFNVLRMEKEYSRNYFLWFAILLLIDNIFIELYKIYQDGLDKQIL